MIVVADATPLRYLLLIECIDILPRIFREITQPRTPELVREWALNLPDWFDVRAPLESPLLLPMILGAGEREAIALAEQLKADVLLVDDWAARREAERRSLKVQGMLGLLSVASELGLIDITEMIGRLRTTNFRASEKLIQFILDRDEDRKKGTRD